MNTLFGSKINSPFCISFPLENKLHLLLHGSSLISLFQQHGNWAILGSPCTPQVSLVSE